jgi:hypothetical protein
MLASWSLDARAPYLADHSPGGVPLLPTALCLQALAQACHARRPGIALAAEDVLVGEPCLVPPGGPNSTQLLVQLAASPDDAQRATLCSERPAGGHAPHLRAAFVAQRPGGHGLSPPAHLRVSVDAALVYRQFFHGPAWRVVAGAGWDGEQLVARLAPGLPPLRHPGGRASVLAPRLLELALQAAGLLEIARSARSMIPHAIGRVEQLLPLDEDSGVPLLAIARAGEAPATIDIDVCTEDGRCAMRVRGYATVPLPFASDPDSLAALATALRAGSGYRSTTTSAAGAH